MNLESDAWKAGLADPAAHRGEATLDAVASSRGPCLQGQRRGRVRLHGVGRRRWRVQPPRAGASVVTPNKKANSSSKAGYAELRELAPWRATRRAALLLRGHRRRRGYPSPRRQSLIATGDKAERIEGIFSGTLSYIFNEHDATKRFSDVVKEAKSLGHTEPDPRDDLDGMDVARKVTILARECGLDAIEDAAAVEKRSLVPAGSRMWRASTSWRVCPTSTTRSRRSSGG